MTQDLATATALERLVREGSDEDLGRFLLLLQPPEIADLIEALRTDEDRARAFRAIVGREEQSKVLRGMEEGEAVAIVEDLPTHVAADLLEEMHSDDAADMLQALDEEHQAQVLEQIEPAEREDIQRILAYPEDSAGGIMQTELVCVRESQRAREAVEEIRRTRDEVGELHEVFVVDRQGRLKGWVKERALILADDDTPIRAITTPVPMRVHAMMDQEEIASLVRDYDVSSVPVVDDQDRLLGRILVDDIVDVFEEEATEDIVRFAGTDPEEIYTPSVASALRSRSPWLVISFVGGVAAASIIRGGEDLVRQAGTLFAFIPVIMGMGGGCAAQTATVTIRSMALGRVGAGRVWAMVAKELTVGILLAGAAGISVWLAATVIGSGGVVAWIAAFAIFGTVCLGILFGVFTPLLLGRLGVDPAVATSPLIQTLNDVLGSTLIVLFCWFVF